MMVRHVFILIGFLWSALLPAESQAAGGGETESDTVWMRHVADGIAVLLQNERLSGFQLGLCIYDLSADTTVFAYNVRQRMRPASTQKLVTAITALEELGSVHPFATRMYVTGAVREGTLWGDVYVVGGFDPAFEKEDMDCLVRRIADSGIDSIAGGLYADVSMKDTLRWGWGWCWDDDMPVLTPLLYNGKDGFMEQMAVALERVGIAFAHTGVARCPEGAVLWAERAHPLERILQRMMKDSDNLYAEAMFYQVAARGGRPYASREDFVYCVEPLISRMGYDPGHYLIADGSGVSLYNYLTPALEVAFLRHAYHDNGIFYPLYAALPIAGKDGTLRRRMRQGRACGNVHAKTGTVEGVSTLAGYATACNGHRIAFSIMTQGVERSAWGRDLQDSICELLCADYVL